MEMQTDRPHICSSCTRGFRKPEHLQRHIRTHTKEKPYVCECGSSFARRDLLQRHKRLHHKSNGNPSHQEDRATRSRDLPSLGLVSDSTSEGTVRLRFSETMRHYRCPQNIAASVGLKSWRCSWSVTKFGIRASFFTLGTKQTCSS
ncbi:hypothetical protein CKAH01_07655 [Colletotrichum kahawae]|uniref:C2H2-type domain-containing protein n=1 Tax=Colletotrichum kahawae TaxID=34407 RepID=A0AAE0D1B1_COLKA|nr:hypothetical protein CKAH01_07655 [Colletotrichum kahawae]